MVRVVGRLIMVPLGFILGALAAMLVLVSLGLELTTHQLAQRADDFDKLEVLVDIGFGVFGMAAVATVVPALLVVIVGEVARIRSALFYVVGGGISMALLPLWSQWHATGVGGFASTRVWTLLATAGFAGGLVYWLVAGRRA